MTTKIGHKHTVVFLLFLFMVINFADKAVIGLAGPDIMKTLHLSPLQFGFVGSSFFFLFSLSGIGFGFLANRIDSHKLVLFLAFLWAILQFPLAATVSYGMLLACRIALGFGEGPAFPLALHTGYQWFENKDRNVPSTIIQQGANTGMMVAGPILTYIIVYFGWHASFLFLGIIGLVWTGAWLAFGFVSRNRPPEIERGEPLVASNFSYRHTLFDPTFVSVLIVYFAEYAMVVILLTWLPAYLRLGLGFSKVQTGWIFSIIVGLQIPITIAVAKISAVLLRRGVSSRLARGFITSAGAVVGGGVLALVMTGISPVAKVACLAIGGVLTQLVFSFGPLIVGEICPEARRGGLFGIVSSIGTLAGIIAPIVMGGLIQADAAPAQGYEHGFLALGLMLALSGVLGIICMNPEKTRLKLSGRAERRAVRMLNAN